MGGVDVRKALVCVNADPGHNLSSDAVAEGIRQLEAQSFLVHRHPAGGELELIVDSVNPDDARRRTTEACRKTFGTMPTVGAVTFLSRGTDEDALGVIEAFGLSAQFERFDEHGEEIAVVTLASADRRRVPESRLHTALEAALNCEVRITFS